MSQVINRIFSGVVMLFLCSAVAVGQSQPRYTEIYSSDSLEVTAPALSPNGKWVVFSARPQRTDKRYLMIIPASGGQPRALTSANFVDQLATWSPRGDRIVFLSSRVQQGLMTLPIDTVRGMAVGMPQRLTLEASGHAFAFSPDGREVAFAALAKNGKTPVKIVPATGGSARLVSELDFNIVPQMYWPTIDSLLLFVVKATAPQPATEAKAVRLATRGGDPVVVETFDPVSGFKHVTPAFFLHGARLRSPADTLGTLRAVSWADDTIARIDTRGTMNQSGLNNHIRATFSSQTVMLALNAGRNATRALSIDGGVPWTVLPISEGEYAKSESPTGFTADSRFIYAYRSRRPTLSVIPVRPGQGVERRIPMPPNVWWPEYATPSGKYVYVFGGFAMDSTNPLHIVDVGTGQSQLISSAMKNIWWGGSGDDFRYAERNGSVMEIRRWSPGKPVKTLLSFPIDPGMSVTSVGPVLSPTEAAVAYNIWSKDSVRTFVAEGSGTPRLISAGLSTSRNLVWSPGGRMLALKVVVPAGTDTATTIQLVTFDERLRQVGPPREILRMSRRPNMPGVRWSPDGKTIAVPVEHARDPKAPAEVVFIPADERTGVVGTPRRVSLPMPTKEWNDVAHWMSDNKHILVPTSNGERITQLWKVSNVVGETPVNIAAQEVGAFWEFIVSPDERTVVYQVDLPMRTSIVKVDLPPFASGSGQTRKR